MRLAIAQVNPTVGDLRGNIDLLISCIEEAARTNAAFVVFPELAISGYPPEDLLLKDHFLRDCRRALEEVATAALNIIALVGVPLLEDCGLSNATGILAGGRIRGFYRKILLPNYAVFDEQRYFTAGDRVQLIQTPDARVGVNVCEDIWYPAGPTEEAALRGGAEVVINTSMSPYHRGKGRDREAMLSGRAADAGAFVIYVNGVGGQDELVFDGQSLVFSPLGELIYRAPQFEEALLFVDLDPEEARRVRGRGRLSGRWETEILEIMPRAGGCPSCAGAAMRTERRAEPAGVADELSPVAEVYRALRLGAGDYVRKNRFRGVVIGMSGGVDSALTACVAVDALGADHVVGVSMPSRFTSSGTRSDARLECERLGIRFLELPIEPVFKAYLDTLAEPFAGLEPDVAEENIQARIRGNVLMALSNKFGWLVLTTGNKSETAVGYTTLYGDMAGGFAVIKDVPKTLVYELARYRNSISASAPLIPVSVLDRPPSAELRLDQTDQDSLPPYEVLDRIIEAYVVRDESVAEIVASGIERQDVERMVALIDRNEYKRRQAAPGVRITPKAFGKDRRLPITNRYGG
jgi:NAD+ synthase (glutamine-hydrolysing)